MKNSAIFVISAILVGALAVAAYTMSNQPAQTEAEQIQQSAADALNGTEPAAGALDQTVATEAAPEATPAATSHEAAEAHADAVEAQGEANVEAAKAEVEAAKDNADASVEAAEAKVEATEDAADAATEAAEEHADEVK